MKIQDNVTFRLYRDSANVADTFTGEAFLLSVGVHYTSDTCGSIQMITK